MEKIVTGIDQEELKKAREEMMAEMGITSTQPEFSEQNNTENSVEENLDNLNEPSKEELSDNDENNSNLDDENYDEELFDLIDDFIQNAENNTDGLISNASQDNNLSENENANTNDNVSEEIPSENLSHYDVFSEYEINSPVSSNVSLREPAAQEINDGFINEESLNNRVISNEPSENISESENIDNISNDQEKLENDEEISNNEILENTKEEEHDSENIDDLIDDIVKNISDDDNHQEQDAQEVSEEQISENVEEHDNTTNSEISDNAGVEQNFEDSLENSKIDSEDINIGADDFNFFGETDEKSSESAAEDNKILNDDAKEDVAEIYVSNKAASIATKEELLPEISSLEFVNVLSMQEFKNSDNFTFVLGRTETGNILFESLKNCYNIAFFANNNSYEMLNTLLLSLMLKNSASEFKFALLDGKNTNTFNYYDASKYLFGGSVAKSEDEILNKLSDVIGELEARYHTLAKFNVRNIDEYNILAKSSGVPKLAHILLVVDGYNELMQSANFEKITNLIYQILRLGRIAGIYVIVVADKNINEDIINFNLPARIGFRCEKNSDSVAMIGESGIDKLANDNEFLYSSINFENAKHLRQPTLSSAITKILIENIEK